MAQKKKDETAAAVDELVTPEEHAEASEGVEPAQHVSDPEVPADVEIASRGADMEAPSDSFVKVYVLGPNPTGKAYTKESGFDHTPNLLATRQFALDAGLWPTGDATFVSSKAHPDGVSTILSYSVPVIPAHAARTTGDGGTHPEVAGEAVITPEGDNVEIVKPKNADADPAPDQTAE